MRRLVLLALFFVACNGFAQTTPSFSGLWWKSSGAEPGWGLNIAHQGNILFATWFTYDADGNAEWLVMPHADLMAMDGGSDGMMMGMGGMMPMMPGMMMMDMPAFGGLLYRTTGPSFDAKSFDASAVKTSAAGYAMLTFTDANTALFEYSLDGVYQAKAVTREAYAALPMCDFASSPSTSNFQDLWWRAGGSEPGWGLNVTQQGGVIFATWFTYDESGHGLWLVMPNATQASPMTYTGKLYRTHGPAFDAQPWSAANVVATEVGSATLAFSDASNGVFTAQVGTATVVKPIAREAFASPASVCH